jgi:hypothetical protein
LNEHDEDRLSTADMAAAGTGATLDRDYARDVELRPGATPPIGGTSTRDESAPLFPGDESNTFRSRWEEIQTTFVDEPRHSVERADELVAEVMKRLADVFSNERSQLETQWTRGDDVSTEDLRIALQRYRTFFDRLLSV